MSRIFRFLAFSYAFLFCFINSAQAGWIVNYADSESGEQSTEYYQDGKANFGSLIYDGRNFILISHQSESYWQGSPDKYCNALRMQKKRMESQYAMMPEQYRPKPLSSKKVTRKKIASETIAGFKSTGYDFFVDGLPQGRVWVSKDSRLSHLINFGKGLSGDMKCFEDMDATTIEGTQLYRNTVKNAFIMKEPHRHVVSVDKQDVSAGIFAAPKRYKSFRNFQEHLDYMNNQSKKSSSNSSTPTDQADDMLRNEYQGNTAEGRVNEPEKKTSKKKNDNVIVKDAKEIADDSVDEAHQSTKRGIKKEVSKDINTGVNKLLKKLF